MKKIFKKPIWFTAGILLVSGMVGSSLSAQVTREQADVIVQNHLQMIEYEVLFVNVNTPSAEGIDIRTSNEETFKANYACWTYYAKEEGKCRYLFVKADNGNLLEVIANNDLGQSDVSQWKTLDEVGVVEKEENAIRPIIYPNPVSDWLRLPCKGERTLVEIHDAKGSRLYSGFLSENDANPLNVSFLSAGLYTVSVYGEAKLVYQFIKLQN